MNICCVWSFMGKNNVKLTVRLYYWKSVLEACLCYGRRNIAFPTRLLGLNPMWVGQINIIWWIDSKGDCNVLIRFIVGDIS